MNRANFKTPALRQRFKWWITSSKRELARTAGSQCSRPTNSRWSAAYPLALTGTIPSLEEIRELENSLKARGFNGLAICLRTAVPVIIYRALRARHGGRGERPVSHLPARRLVSWLSDEIHVNRPHDRIVRSLITAKGLWTNNPEVKPDGHHRSKTKTRAPTKLLAARVTRAFLVHASNAQCHDDYLGDDWLQKDFHQLASFFAKPT